MNLLEIKNLHTHIDGKSILKGIDLIVKPGEVHAIMGPNGSGKSTLTQVIAGREEYQVTQGQVLYKGKDLLQLAPEIRAREGIFVAFQYPVEIPGVNNSYFLRTAMNAIRKHKGEEELDAFDFQGIIKEQMNQIDMAPDMLDRSVNEGFSGGEKKETKYYKWHYYSRTSLFSTKPIPALISMHSKSLPMALTGPVHPIKPLSLSPIIRGCSITSSPTSSMYCQMVKSLRPVVKNWH